MNDTEQTTTYKGWAIVQQMGHVKLAGYVTEVQLAGYGVLSVAIPDGDRTIEKLIPPSTLYDLTWVGEDEARRVAKSNPVEPISEWTVRQEVRERIEREERESIEKQVRRQVAIERAAEDRGLPPEATAVYQDAATIHTDDDYGDDRDDEDWR